MACPPKCIWVKKVEEAKWWTTLLTLVQRGGKTTNLPASKQRERERESLSLFPLFFQLLPAPPPFLQKGSNLASFSMLLFLSTMLGLFVCWPFLALPCLAYQGKDIVFRFIIEYSSFRDFYRPP